MQSWSLCYVHTHWHFAFYRTTLESVQPLGKKTYTTHVDIGDTHLPDINRRDSRVNSTDSNSSAHCDKTYDKTLYDNNSHLDNDSTSSTHRNGHSNIYDENRNAVRGGRATNGYDRDRDSRNGYDTSPEGSPARDPVHRNGSISKGDSVSTVKL